MSQLFNTEPAKRTLVSFADENRRQMFVFGVVLFINYPLYYIIWRHTGSPGFESLTLRLIASTLCLPLIFNKYWPIKLLYWLTLYWYLAACFCLPFFFGVMALKNGASTLWLMNTVSATFFILLIFDWKISITLLCIGIVSAVVVFFSLSTVPFSYTPGEITLGSILATFLAAIVIGSLFSHNKQLIEKIRRDSIQAHADSEVKSQFISDMEHDIRTPASGMYGMMKVLAENEKDPERKSTFELLELCSKELMDYCDGIVSFSRTESGATPLISKAFKLEDVIQSVYKLEILAAKVKNIGFASSCDDNLPEVIIGDPERVRRILINLVSNAIKFTEKGHVKLSASLDHQDNINRKVIIKLTVEDTGIGIPEDKTTFVYERFTKLTRSNKGTRPGQGLGLTIVKQFVGELDGDIHLTSEVGKGSIFDVYLAFKMPLSENMTP